MGWVNNGTALMYKIMILIGNVHKQVYKLPRPPSFLDVGKRKPLWSRGRTCSCVVAGIGVSRCCQDIKVLKMVTMDINATFFVKDCLPQCACVCVGGERCVLAWPIAQQ